jgi:hypothetical protein
MSPLRRQRWPRVAHSGQLTPGEVKRVSVAELASLTAAAASARWSASGRPTWLAANAERLRWAFLTVFAVESPGVFRCFVTPQTFDDSLAVFTLDVGIDRFDRLQTVTDLEAVELLHRLLAAQPVIPLDPEQRETWPDWTARNSRDCPQ